MKATKQALPKPTFATINAEATMEAQAALLDLAKKRMGLKNDAALSRALGVAPPVLSKVRRKVLDVGAMLAVNLHETAGISIADIKAILQGSKTA